ncbi:calcium-activated chloride channel regulator 1-like [Tropilaelaps mercedesae]|uniref:Calcium-activated chloride channel regulator 1-like n=1 Tax=Tropilaelaps mercedesae TaxID=418985 RepID=A0A1V9X9G0_9ACAR|nr:calcium-activated chloride channel regulator 1-like [Tropilaelaps mercedesae]
MVALATSVTHSVDRTAVLRNASLELFRARGVYLAEVTVVIPRSWESKGNWARQPLPRVEAPSWQQWDRADILIERGEESVFGENPFAVQYAGCGVQGRHLVVPDTFLRSYAANGEHAANWFDKYGKPHHVFLREWAVYRYGVFKEHGFPRDPVYPLYLPRSGSQDPNDIELNVCADRPVRPEFRNGNGMSCNATINLMNGLPLDHDCIPVYSVQHDAVEASLMSGLPSATHFCGSPRPHDQTLPTKHNVMCNQRSTTEVIEQHPDFHQRPRSGLLGRTRFIFVQEKAQVLAFVIQITGATMQHNRRNYILRALNQFLRSEAPSDMQIALVTYGTVASEIALRRASANDESVRNAVDAFLLNADIESGNSINSTLEDGLRSALEALNDTSEITERVPPNGFTKRVMIIGDGHLDQHFDDIVRHNFDIQGIRVDAIIFPSPEAAAAASASTTSFASSHASDGLTSGKGPSSPRRPMPKRDNTLDTFVAQTGGRTVAVDDTPIDTSITVTALQELYDSLYTFTYAGTSAAQYDSFSQIEQKEFYGKEQNEMVFEFDVDPTLNAELRVRLVGHDYGSDRPWTVSPKDILLFAPIGHTNGKKLYSPKDYKYVSTNAQFWYYEFKIPDPAVGRWRLEAKARKDTKQPIIVSSAAKPATDDDEPISVDVWISQPSYNVSLREEGLIVYAKVSKGSRPVVDVNVVAKIIPVSDQTETQMCIELKDNGAGDPDMTKDDGVYSRYIEGIKSIGRHRLVVEVKTEGNAAVLRGATVPDDSVPHTACCGSAVMRTALNATRPFARRVSFGSFFVTRVAREQRDGEVRAPWSIPGRIADLHVVYLQSSHGGHGGVSLGWTATGNVRDHGRAAAYILKRFDNRNDAVTQFDERGQEISQWEVEGSAPLPKEAGNPEQVFIKLANGISLPQYFALKVNNTYGVLSAVSNIVTISVLPPVTTTTSSIWGLGSSPGQGGSGVSGGATVGDSSFTDQLPSDRRGDLRLLPGQLALIIAVPLVLLVLGVCILIVIVAKRRRDPLLDKDKKVSTNDKSNATSLNALNNGTLPKDPNVANTTPVLTPSPVLKEGLSPVTTMAPHLPLSSSMTLDHVPMTIDHSISMSDPMNMSVTMSINQVPPQQPGGLSPVNHWPAEVLLEHYNRVQEAKQRNELPPVLSLQPGHPDESVHSSNPSVYNTIDPFRHRHQSGNTAPACQINGAVQHPVNTHGGIYSPYYGNVAPIVTPTGVHVNSSRNITHV